MATPSSVLAWRIPRTEKPGGPQSREPQRAGHDRATEHTHSTQSSGTVFVFLRFYFLAPPRDIQDVSCPTRDQTHILSSGSAAS